MLINNGIIIPLLKKDRGANGNQIRLNREVIIGPINKAFYREK